MKTEFEVQIFDIDKEKVIEKLNSIGAVRVGEKNFRRNIYDVENDKKNWIRLRCDGKKVTLTYKEVQSFEIDGTKEVGVIVDNFDRTAQFLEKSGLKHRAYQENKRTSYKLGNVKIEIDEWPLIPVYIEIEGESAEEVEKAISLLGYKRDDAVSICQNSIYKKYGIDLPSYKILKF